MDGNIHWVNWDQNGTVERLKQLGVQDLKLFQNRLGGVRQDTGFGVHSNPERITVNLGGAVLDCAPQRIGTNSPARWRVMSKTYRDSADDEKKQHS